MSLSDFIGPVTVGAPTGNVSGVPQSISNGSVVLAGGPNVTLSQDGRTITISAAAGGVGGGAAISAGASSQNTGTIIFSSSNGIQFGLNAGTMTASYTVPAVPPETPFGVSAGTQSVSTGTLVFSNSNNVTFGMSGSSRITASASFPAETPFGVSAGTQSVSTGTLVFSNSNNVTFGMSGSSRVTASASFPAETPFGVSAGTQSVSTGTLVFSNSNNVTFGMSGSSRVTASASFPAQTNQQMTLFATGNTTLSSTGTTNASSVIFRGSGVASVGITNGSILIDVPAGGGAAGTNTLGMSNLGNTSGTTGVITGSALQFVLAGGNNITLSQSINGSSATITISGPNTAAETPFGVSAGTQSVSTGTLVFSDSHNVTFGMSGSSRVTASASFPAQTNQQMTLFATGNTTLSSTGTTNASSIIFRGSGVASVGITNGSILIDVPAGVGAGFSAGVSTGGATSGDTGITGTRLVLAGTNITMSQATDANGGTITVSGPTNGGITLGGNSTSAGAGFIFISSGTMTLAGNNNITLSQNGNAVSISAANETPFGVSAGTQSVSTGTLVFSDSHNVTFGMSGSSRITASASFPAETPFGVSAGTQSVSTGTLVFSNSNNVAFGMSGSSRVTASVALSMFAVSNTTQSSSGSANVSALSFGGAGAASVGVTGGSVVVSVPPLLTEQLYVPWFPTGPSAISNAVLWIGFTNIPFHVTASRVEHQIQVNMSTSSNSSHAGIVSYLVGVYTLNGSTLSLASSASTTASWSNTSNNSTSVVSGNRLLSATGNFNFTGGSYFIAQLIRTSTTNANWFTLSNRINSGGQSAMGYFGAASAGSRVFPFGFGAYSATTGALPSSIGVSQIVNTNGVLIPVIQFANTTV